MVCRCCWNTTAARLLKLITHQARHHLLLPPRFCTMCRDTCGGGGEEHAHDGRQGSLGACLGACLMQHMQLDGAAALARLIPLTFYTTYNPG